MKLGLLICDRVNREYLHIQGDYPEMFQRLLPGFQCEIYYVFEGHFPKTAEECDAWLVSGSRHSVYENIRWIVRLKILVREIHLRNKAYIGVCFGHQILAEALGGKVEKAAEGWCVGVHQFEIQKPEPWMDPNQVNLNLLMLCQDQVKVLPPNSTVLGQSANCPVGVFKVGNKMLGIQAHPEFSKTYNKVIFESREDRIGKKTIYSAQNSLIQPVHQQIIAKWIVNFLKL